MKKLLLTLSLSAFAATASAATPLWLRDVKISPDGKEIAFTYKGDIYKVPVSGGDAVRLTSQPSYDATPIWSPDGKSIAFSSTRNGSMGVYIMPLPMENSFCFRPLFRTILRAHCSPRPV